MIVALFVLVGLSAGLVCGGHFSNLASFRLRGEWIALAALAAQSILRGPIGDSLAARFRVTLWLLAAGVALIVSLANVRQTGMPIVALGLALNVMVVAANLGMPVSSASVAVISGNAKPPVVSTGFYHEADSGTLLLPLADVIPLPGPPTFRSVFSIGDAALWIGIAVVLASATLGRRLDEL